MEFIMHRFLFAFLLVPLLAAAQPQPSEPASRPAAIVLESGLGLATGALTAAALYIPIQSANSSLGGFESAVIVGGIGNAVGSGLGVAWGGSLAHRQGSLGYTLLASLAGQAVGAAAGMALYNALNPSRFDTPVALTVTFSLATVFGVTAYNLTDR
jgi:hypothetical protein